jgi:fumarate reductase subunit D
MGTILLILLILFLLGSFPAYPYSRNWGYAPSGVAGLLVVVLIVLLLMNVLPWGWGPSPTPVVP